MDYNNTVKIWTDKIHTCLTLNDESKCIELLQKFDHYYYNKYQLVPDRVYDVFRETIQQRFPNNDYFKNVGSPVTYGEKIKHDIPMLSMGKANDIDEVVKWLNKISDERLWLLIEPKIDGLSCKLKYVNGKLDHIATRGDGKIGQNITHIKEYIKDIPETLIMDLKDEIEIRGELFLPKDTAFPNPEKKPLRNLCSGLINRKENLEDLVHVRFSAYQLVTKVHFHWEHEKLEILEELKIPTVIHQRVKSIKEIEEFYENYLDSYREDWKYETDGLIITTDELEKRKDINAQYVVDHHNHYDIAFKPPSESAITKLIGIEWNTSRLGNVVPVGIVEPIVIGGSKIQRVTLNNYENVETLNLFNANEVEISKANDVIPYFKDVISRHDENKIEDIKNCPSCNSLLDREGVHITCVSKICTEKKIQKILYWVKKADMYGVSEQTVRKLHDNGLISSIQGLYHLTKERIKELDGFEDRSAEIVIEAIEKSKVMTAQDFITRLGIASVGKKSLKKLGINTMDEFYKFKDITYAVGRAIIEYRTSNENQIKSLLTIVDIVKEDTTTSKGKVAMTGKGHKGRKELIKDIEGKGYEFADSITSSTDILVCEDVNGGSSKLKKARKLGVKLMSYEDFFN